MNESLTLRRHSRLPQWITGVGVFVLSCPLLAIVPKQPPEPSSAPAPLPATDTASGKPGQADTLDWESLLPPDERGSAQSGPPPPVHDYLGEAGMAVVQSGSADVNPALNLKVVKMPGFVVPLELTNEGKVLELFLVPYVGACIHVPPPPPNQIVYVKLNEPIRVPSLSDAVWVTGTLRTQLKNSGFGAAAYTLEATRVEPYDFQAN
jgi:uncharacterized protein